VLAAGSRVGAYRVLEALGAGGMGAVYKARHEATGELVALKVILPQHAGDGDFMSRFRREARAAAVIEHPHVTALREVGDHEGQPFLAFEYVPGGSLDRLLREKGRLPWREACARGAEVASALAALHAKGLVHRDVKPENVLLDENGRAKLADFGLVRHDKASGKWLTMSTSISDQGELVGSYAYVAPEQADAAGAVDARADLYSLGALIFALLTGGPPFEGRGVEVLVKLFQRPPPSPRKLAPETPERLERLVLSLLAKDPARRPRSALEVAGKLEALGRQPRTTRRLALLAALLLGAAASGAVVTEMLIARSQPAPERPPPTPSAAMPVVPPAPELVRRGEEKSLAGDQEGAIAEATKAIELDPLLAKAWDVRGVARAKRGDKDGAMADFTRAIELSPTLADAWRHRGKLRADNGDWDGTILDETRAIELAPGFAMAWDTRGAARAVKGDLDGTIPDFTRALELDPKLASTWQHRGSIRLVKGDLAGAFADCTRAIELAPKLATPLGERADARLKMGDLDGAFADCAKAIELDPKLAKAWLIRGCVRLQRGEVSGAIADLESGLELEPAGPSAVAARSWLEEAKSRAR